MLDSMDRSASRHSVLFTIYGRPVVLHRSACSVLLLAERTTDELGNNTEYGVELTL